MSGAAISSAAFNTLEADIGTEITNSVDRQGRSPMQAALPMGNNKITGLATPTVATDAATKAYVDAAVPADQAITLPKLQHPGYAGYLLGTHSNTPVAITGAANNGSGLIRLTVTSTAGFVYGYETVAGVVGTTEANGRWIITIIDATHVDLGGSTFVNAYSSGGTLGGGVELILLGAGLTMNAGTLSSSAPSLPGAVGLVITNDAGTPNSKVDITADMAILLAGSVALYATAVSVVVDTSVVGVINGLDAGSRAASTWYNLFLISNGTITAGLASLSATAPTLPSGYTYLVRVGAMRTDGSGNFLRTRQVGNIAEYTPVAATNTTVPPVMANATNAAWTAISVAPFVPPTATRIRALLSANGLGQGQTVVLAPSNGYPTAVAASQPGAFSIGFAGSINIWANSVIDLVLQSGNIYYGNSAGTGAVISAMGWADKVNAS